MQHGHIKLPLAPWKLPLDSTIDAHDLLTGETYRWRGEWNYVRLDPPIGVAHVIALTIRPPLATTTAQSPIGHLQSPITNG
jgi:hypothetical protein